MSRARAKVLAVFTVWPVFYLPGVILAMMLADLTGHEFSVSVFYVIFACHALTLLEIFVVLGVYLFLLFESSRIPQEYKALWAVALLIGNMVSMPVFWYAHVWKPLNQRAPEEALPSA